MAEEATHKMTATSEDTGVIPIDILDSNGQINFTALVLVLKDLTSASRQVLFDELDLNSEEELYQFLDAAESKSREEQLLLHNEYRVHKILRLYIPPLLILIGTIGNVLSFCVLIRKAMRRTSTYNYLAVLSFTDMLVLYVGLLRLWVGELTGTDIRDMSDWSCKLNSMVGYTVSMYSVWLLIAVTVERYIVTVHSLRASTMCTQGRAVKTIACILILLMLINLHFLWTTTIRMDERKGEMIPECSYATGYKQFVEQVWPWIDAFLYCLLPFVIICILNSLIVQKVIISRRSRRLLAGSRCSATSAASTRSSSESSVRVTIMLLTISFTFLICTLPMNVTIIHGAYLGFDAPSLQEESRYSLARTISELLMYTNHSINFYLYLLTGNKFRQQLLTMLCPCRTYQCPTTNYSVVTQDGNPRTTKVVLDTEMTVIKNGNYSQISDDTE